MAPFSLRKSLPLFVGLVVLILLFRFFLPIILPFLLAALLALLAEPLVAALQRFLRFSRTWAAILGVFVALLVTTLAVVALCALLVRQLKNLSGVLPDLESATLSGLNALELWLLDLAQRTPESVRSVLTHSVEEMFSGGSALLDQLTSTFFTLASGMLKGLPSSALGVGTWILASFMFSVRLPRIRSWLKGNLPSAWRERYLPWLNTLKKTLCGWLKAQAKLIGITFGVLVIGFLLLQISHPFLWAGVVCLVDILPVLGTGTVLIPWSLVLFLQGAHLQGVGMLSIYAVITLLRSVLEPRLVGKQLGLDPLITLLAIYAGFRLWGLPGMLFAPILAVVVTQFLPKAQKKP